MKYLKSETDTTKDTVVCYCVSCGDNIENEEHVCEKTVELYCANCGDEIGKNEENWQNHWIDCCG